MGEMSDKVRQEAAATVISECKQWLAQIMAEEMEKIREEVRFITDSRLKVEQIAAAFEEDSKRITEEEVATIVAEPNSGLGKKRQKIKMVSEEVS